MVALIRSQHDFVVADFLLERHDRVQDRIVVLVAGQRVGQAGAMRLGLEKQSAAAFVRFFRGGELIQLQAFLDNQLLLRRQ
jgi:hypothetical protein